MRHKFNRKPCFALIALAAAAATQPALAVDYVWKGGGGTWEDAAMWTLLGVPGSGDTATINFTSTGSVALNTTRSIDGLTMNGGSIGGAGTLNTGSLIFNGGNLGATAFGAGGTVNVAGSTVFNGEANQGVMWSQTLNLNGNSTWTAGNGRLTVDSAYSAGSTSYASAILHIASGTTFSDLGAASSAGYKVLGGGNSNVVNDGTYTRSGLGATWVRGLNNAGTLNVSAGTLGFDSGNWLNTSSGVINVAAGTTLEVANLSVTAGSINNNGLVRVFAGSSEIAAAASISGAWQMDAGQLTLNGSQSVSSFTMNDGRISGAGTLNTNSFIFNEGTLGGTAFGTGGTVNVSGNSLLNGAVVVDLQWSQTLNLNGNSTWTAGNGRIAVETAYSAGSTSYATSALNIGTGATFTDQGAASATTYKQIGGGLTTNAGTYERNGLGTTTARNFQNSGQLNVNSGTFEVDQKFVNTGTVQVAAGATLAAFEGVFANAGVFTGTGTVKTFRITDALANSGTIDPGSASAVGTLTIAGDLSMADSATLRIDLANGGLSDLLAISSDVLWNGELAIWATPDLALQGGEVFTIATYGQRLSASTFDSITWHGLDSQQFTVSYSANDITLRVSAVPEPGSVLLMLAGVVFVGAAVQRRLART